MSGSVLSIRDLTVSFPASAGGRHRAVDGVSLDLPKGTLTALVGESGSGKSVTAMSVLGLVPAPPARRERGAILLEREGGSVVDLASAPLRALRRIRGREIAMIFQEPMTSLNPVLSIGAQIVEAIRLHRRVSVREARSVAVDALDRVGIPDPGSRLGQYPHEFSGGMRQRVMIAIALACEPRVLIADEPTTALDVTIQATILDLIRDLVVREGLTVLLITHDLALVSAYADRIAVMYRGFVVESGNARAVLETPAHPYTRGLLATAPELGQEHRRLATLDSVMGKQSLRPIAIDGKAMHAWTPGSDATSGHAMRSLGEDHLVRVGLE
jgi:ABC-type dipeptide/oligopeptide/nickel transport system ATPase component